MSKRVTPVLTAAEALLMAVRVRHLATAAGARCGRTDGMCVIDRVTCPDCLRLAAGVTEVTP